MKQLGHYQILSQLGVGGMGEVYLARDTRLDRTAALKILPAGVASDQDRMQRFIREAKAASALNHPNVATIYDVGEADGINFISMEYVEGQTLAAKISGRALVPAEIVAIAVQVADALDAAHTKGLSGDAWIVAQLGYAYAASGVRSEAQKMLQEFKEQAARGYVDPYFIAVIYLGLGEKDQVFAWLDKAFDERSIYIAFLNADPQWDSLRPDRRFTSLLRRIGLKP